MIPKENLNLEYNVNLLIAKALNKTSSRQNEACKLLGVSVKTVYRAIRDADVVFENRNWMPYQDFKMNLSSVKNN
jgi:DNA-binding NtrC family response regulator